MPGTIKELLKSRNFSTGLYPRGTRSYFVNRATDEQEARELTTDFSSTGWEIYGSSLIVIPRTSIEVDEPMNEWPDGTMDFVTRAVYGSLQDNPLDANETTTLDDVFSSEFEASTQSQRIYSSREVLSRSGTDLWVAAGRLIGISDNGTDGTDIVVPTWARSETHRFSPADLTLAKIAVFRNTVGKVNDAAWREFTGKRECLMHSITGKRRDTGSWDISFRFLGSETFSNLEIDDGSDTPIVVTQKLGWDYLDIRFMPREIDIGGRNVMFKVPVEAIVHRVYDEADFTLLGIGS